MPDIDPGETVTLDGEGECVFTNLSEADPASLNLSGEGIGQNIQLDPGAQRPVFVPGGTECDNVGKAAISYSFGEAAEADEEDTGDD